MSALHDLLAARDRDNAYLRARVAELEAVLREVEWVAHYSEFNQWAECPECGGEKPKHTPACRLSAAIKPQEPKT